MKYVYVYDYTSTVVYVGYTPGYMGCYVYGTTIVYGTGYYYYPWYGVYYYPRPVTYGFHVHYNPWTGWSVGISMSVGGPYGWVIFSYRSYPSYWGPHYGGYWGPHAYHPPVHYHCNHYYGRTTVNVNVHNHNNNYYNRREVNVNQNNIYNNRSGVNKSTMDNKNPQFSNNKGSKPGNLQNNVYTDKAGNVYKGDSKQNWQSYDGQKWNKTPSANDAKTKAEPKQQPQQFDKNQMNQQSQNRDRGTQNNTNYNQFKNQTGGTRPAGGGGGFKKGGR